MKDNKKVIKIVVLCIIVALVATFIGISISNNKTNTNVDSCDNCTVDTSNNVDNKTNNNVFGLNYSGKTVQYNAYDFIIEKMSQAQYWTYEEFEPGYSFNHLTDDGAFENEYWADKLLSGNDEEYPQVIKNGTGWVLYDESKAQFVRGYTSRMIIDFSDGKAINERKFSVNAHNDNEMEKVVTEPIDYSMATVYNINVNEETEYGKTSPAYLDNNVTNYYDEIYDTIHFYNDIFESLGIPLLNQPKGTLTSYKNKTINVPQELVDLKFYERWNDNKIHSPLDSRNGWKIDWNQDDNIWLEDAHDVWNQEFPPVTEEEMVSIPLVNENNEKIDTKVFSQYSPLYIVFADKDNWSGYGSENRNEYDTWDNSFIGALFTYYMKPLYKEVFGINGVYFTETKNFDEQSNISSQYSKEKKFNTLSGGSAAFQVFSEGNTPIGEEYHRYDLDMLRDKTNEILEHYQKENIFGDDYIRNIYYIYDEYSQECLGLR